MNCAHCGAPITLEEKYCPHCGQPNIQAARHSEDMARYRNEFENTRRGVHVTLRAYKGITARLILFIIVDHVFIIEFIIEIIVIIVFTAKSIHKSVSELSHSVSFIHITYYLL